MLVIFAQEKSNMQFSATLFKFARYAPKSIQINYAHIALLFLTCLNDDLHSEHIMSPVIYDALT